MTDWYEWIKSIAIERVNDIEMYLNHHLDEHPHFAAASAALDEAIAISDEAHDEKLSARDDLWISYSGALALEMYLAGARDGGRVYHAIITGELPSIHKQEEHHEQTDA